MITLAIPSSLFPFMHELQAPSMDKISWIQRDTVSHSLVRKIFLRPPFGGHCRPFFRYPVWQKERGRCAAIAIHPSPRDPAVFPLPPAP